METYTNEEGTVNDESKDINLPVQDSPEPVNQDTSARRKIHSSAMYAASMWHSSVKHAKPSHASGSLMPTQA